MAKTVISVDMNFSVKEGPQLSSDSQRVSKLLNLDKEISILQ